MIEADDSKKRLNEFSDALWRYTREAFEKGLLNGALGFLSVRVGKNQALITPPVFEVKKLMPQEMLLYDFKGHRRVPAGRAEDHPEIDFVLNTMKVRHDIFAVGHFHPWYATAFSKVSRSIPFVVNTAEAVLKEILWVKCKTCPHRFEGLCQCVEGQRKSYTGVNHLLIEKDGIVTMGKDLKEVCALAELMESNAKAAYQLSKPVELV